MSYEALLRISKTEGKWTQEFEFYNVDDCLNEAIKHDNDRTIEMVCYEFIDGKAKVTTLKRR